MAKPDETPEPEVVEKPDAELAALMADTFGETAAEEYLDVVDDELLEETESEEVEEEEEEESEEVEDDEPEEEVEDEELDEEEDQPDDEDDESEEVEEDGESETGGDQTEGEGAEDDAPSDGQVALDLMADQTLRAYREPADDFDDSVIPPIDEYVADTKEAFGEEFDDEYVAKLARANRATAIRVAKQRHEQGAAARTAALDAQDSARIRAEIQAIGASAPDELERVDPIMSRIWQEKCNKFGKRAANSLPVEVYFRLAGGKLKSKGKKPKSSSGVATRQAKAQKAGAVRGQTKPGQVGRVRAGNKKRKSPDEIAIEQLNGSLSSHMQIEAALFGD